MKISPLLAALGGGAVGLGMSQGGGGGLAAMSPLLALLLHNKKHGGQAPTETPAAAPPVAANPAAAIQPPVNPGAPAPQAQQGQVDPEKRRRLAAMLMQFGGNMAQSPFGRSY